MKALVVVAHPDDETIWMGGVVLRFRWWQWHVMSLCRADDPDRAPRFFRAAEALRMRPYISDLDDGATLAALSSDLSEITQRIKHAVPPDFDLIFTHGARGEYTRHERHEQVHQAVISMAARGELMGDLAFFAYEDRGGLIKPRPAGDAQIRFRLSADEYEMKQRIIREIYGFGEGSFELEAAGVVEAFRLYPDGSPDHLLAAAALMSLGEGSAPYWR